MRNTQQRQLDALRRVQGFIIQHADALGPITSLDGRAQVDAAIAGIDAMTHDQKAANQFLAGSRNRQVLLARQLFREHLLPVARFARAKLADAPDLKSLAPAVDQRNFPRLATAARATATAVTKYAESYLAGGFPADEAQQINAIVDQIMAIQSACATLVGGRVNATRRIIEHLRAGMAGARQLDAVIIKQFASNPGMLAEWRSASRVQVKPGLPRGARSVKAVD